MVATISPGSENMKNVDFGIDFGASVKVVIIICRLCQKNLNVHKIMLENRIDL
jgi:hypothetical protein